MESNNFIKITPEIIEQACSYIPLLEKQKMAETIGQKCVARVQMTMVGSDGHKKSLPDRFQEMQFLTNLYLMGILAKCYLNMPYDGDADVKDDNPYYGLQMPVNVYDSFAGSHVINQLEQLKMDKSCKDKIYNILYDYRKMQRMISAEIETAVEHQNDIVWRFLDAIELSSKESFLKNIEDANPAAEKNSEESSADQITKAKERLEAFETKVAQLAQLSQGFRQKIEKMELQSEKGAAADA